jgi:hypothetical protein
MSESDGNNNQGKLEPKWGIVGLFGIIMVLVLAVYVYSADIDFPTQSSTEFTEEEAEDIDEMEFSEEEAEDSEPVVIELEDEIIPTLPADAGFPMTGPWLVTEAVGTFDCADDNLDLDIPAGEDVTINIDFIDTADVLYVTGFDAESTIELVVESISPDTAWYLGEYSAGPILINFDANFARNNSSEGGYDFMFGDISFTQDGCLAKQPFTATPLQ